MAVIKLVLTAAALVVVAVNGANGDYLVGQVDHLGHVDHLAHFISKRAVLLDDDFAPVAAASAAEEAVVAPTSRQPRESPYPAPIAKSYPRGRVGPVYTFVKTDYNGNFKWGVRHRAGAQYGGGYH
nr:uncharacterized protein LOC123766337 [Procambarus clarkii]